VADNALQNRIRSAWLGRISGCQLGKPVEVLSMREGLAGLERYLERAGVNAIRDYLPFVEHPRVLRECCRDHIVRSEPDDDINYSLLALIMLEEHGENLQTVDVARAWLRLLPAGKTYTAERAAYAILLARAAEWFAEGAAPGFDLGECARNPYNTWIGAQIRADVYGWVLPGEPGRAAELARRDAALSHVGDGVYGAMLVAALGAALAADAPDRALERALATIPADSDASAAVALGRSLVGSPDAVARMHAKYEGMSPVHTLNNLAVVVWALYTHLDDFGAAIGDAVGAGWDTDCNGATVGGLWGLQGGEIPEQWTAPWRGRVALSLAGHDELPVDALVERTVAVARRLSTHR
jgi:ADP-ribosylglycohydrolase